MLQVCLVYKSVIDSFNDYRPIALTSVKMQCFEKSDSRYIKVSPPSNFDPHQIVSREENNTEDATALPLKVELSHLKSLRNCVRMALIDYSLSFNVIIPDVGFEKIVKLD